MSGGIVPRLTTHFDDAVRQMPHLLRRLLASPVVVSSSRRAIANGPGVYLLGEGGSPVYVGQSRKLRTRLAAHGRPSSRHFSASFAFLLARAEAREAGVQLPALPRGEIETHPSFATRFVEAKLCVARMDVQVIEVENPIARTMFEMYVTEALGLQKYNSFETH